MTGTMFSVELILRDEKIMYKNIQIKVTRTKKSTMI